MNSFYQEGRKIKNRTHTILKCLCNDKNNRAWDVILFIHSKYSTERRIQCLCPRIEIGLKYFLNNFSKVFIVTKGNYLILTKCSCSGPPLKYTLWVSYLAYRSSMSIFSCTPWLRFNLTTSPINSGETLKRLSPT